MTIARLKKCVTVTVVFTVATLSSGVVFAAACPLSEDAIYDTLTELIFAVLDLDDDGYVTVEELGQISQELADGEVGDYIAKWPNGISRWWVHRALETFRVLSLVDANGDGLLQFEEVSEYVPIAAFMYVDLNDNMVIDCEDWAALTAAYTTAEGEEECGTVDLLYLAAVGIITYIDQNEDGVVGMEEVQSLTEEYASSVFVILDNDSDNRITAEELTVFLSGVPLNVIGLLDQNGDGIIRKLEVVLFVPNEIFDALDVNSDNALDCTDAFYFLGEGEDEGEEPPAEGEAPPIEGEVPPVEGEEPPVEGEEPVEGEVPPVEGEEPPVEGEEPLEGEVPPAEGELIEAPCPLPVVTMESALNIVMPFVDTDNDDHVSLAEIRQVYPSFESDWFDMVDGDSDGQLSRQEILSIAVILIAGDDLVTWIDTNGDRLIQYAEVSGYVNRSGFDYLDVNTNGVLDCEDLAFLLPPAEGESPLEGEHPVEGEEPPMEGEEPPSEGEPVEPPCSLPVVTVEDALDIIIPYVDTDEDGGISLDEILQVYPSFASSWFDMVDSDSNDLLSREELLSIAVILPVGNDVVPWMDTNGDRLVKFSEISDYMNRREFDYLDVNANEVLDCEDLEILLSPAEGEPPVEGESPVEGEYPPVEGECEAYPLSLSPFSGRFGFYMEGPYNFVGDLTKENLTDPAWRLSGMFTFNTSGFTVSQPIVSIAESYPEQVSITLAVNRPAPETVVLPVSTQISVTASILASDQAIFTVRLVVCTSTSSIEGETLPEEGEPQVEGEPPAEGETLTEGELPVEDEGEGEVAGHDWGWPPYLGERCISRNLVVVLRRMFVLVDANEDGVLTYDEIRAHLMLPPRIFEWLDTDSDSILTWDEITAWRNAFPASDPDAVIDLVRTITLADESGFFSAGVPFLVHVQLVKRGGQVLNAVNLTEILPEGWAIEILDKAEASVTLKSVENVQALQFDWMNPVEFPMEITYQVTPSGDASGIHTILGQIGYLNSMNEEMGEGIIPTVLAALLPQEYTHSADTDGDWRITLGELLRVIQLFNGGAYHWDESVEGGYAPGLGAIPEGWNHHADYNNNGRIELAELLRVIQLYNSETRFYYISDRSEDGYMVAPF